MPREGLGKPAQNVAVPPAGQGLATCQDLWALVEDSSAHCIPPPQSPVGVCRCPNSQQPEDRESTLQASHTDVLASRTGPKGNQRGRESTSILVIHPFPRFHCNLHISTPAAIAVIRGYPQSGQNFEHTCSQLRSSQITLSPLVSSRTVSMCLARSASCRAFTFAYV